MKKNPFSLFDFLGYVFPGALALFFIYFFHELTEKSTIDGFRSIIDFAFQMDPPFSLENTLLLTILSYVLGHFIAYLSSLTVEQFAIWLYGYPSDFLLESSTKWHYWYSSQERPRIRGIKSFFHCMHFYILTYFWRVLVGTFLIPLTLGTLFIANSLGLKRFFVKKLDDSMVETIKEKCVKLAQYLGYKLKNTETDFHRVIYHYVYERQKAHAIKMDNYVALYGFLRAMTFIFDCVFLYLTIVIIRRTTFDFFAPIDWSQLLLLFGVMIITYVFFMGYMKFSRRFTLESFMCLISDKSYESQA